MKKIILLISFNAALTVSYAQEEEPNIVPINSPYSRTQKKIEPKENEWGFNANFRYYMFEGMSTYGGRSNYETKNGFGFNCDLKIKKRPYSNQVLRLGYNYSAYKYSSVSGDALGRTTIKGDASIHFLSFFILNEFKFFNKFRLHPLIGLGFNSFMDYTLMGTKEYEKTFPYTPFYEKTAYKTGSSFSQNQIGVQMGLNYSFQLKKGLFLQFEAIYQYVFIDEKFKMAEMEDFQFSLGTYFQIKKKEERKKAKIGK